MPKSKDGTIRSDAAFVETGREEDAQALLAAALTGRLVIAGRPVSQAELSLENAHAVKKQMVKRR